MHIKELCQNFNLMALQLKLCCHRVNYGSRWCMSANTCSLFQGVIATLCSVSASLLTTLRLCAGTFAGKREMMSLSGMTLSQSANGKYTSI